MGSIQSILTKYWTYSIHLTFYLWFCLAWIIIEIYSLIEIIFFSCHFVIFLQEEELRGSTDPKYQHLQEDLHVEITAFAPPGDIFKNIFGQ